MLAIGLISILINEWFDCGDRGHLLVIETDRGSKIRRYGVIL